MQSGSPYSPLRVVAAPEVFFILGRPGDEKDPPRRAHCVRLLPPRGGRFSSWGGPAMKNAPRGAHLSASANYFASGLTEVASVNWSRRPS